MEVSDANVEGYRERHRRAFRVYPIFPELVAVYGEGTVVKDIRGKKYLDFSTPSAIVGHNHPRIVEAIKAQAEKLTHIEHAITEPTLQLAEILKMMAPGSLTAGKVVLGCSGTESVEFALKLARYHTKRPVVISYVGAHHGYSPAVLPFTSDYSGSKLYHFPYIVESLYAPYPHCHRCMLHQVYPDCSLACLEYIRDLLDQVVPPESVAAVLAEPLLSWSGFVKPPDDYFTKLKLICEEHGILLIDDEVLTGFGRTGRVFAIEHFGVDPDVICTGKSMGGGMPISAVLAGAEMMDKWETGHIRTSSSAGNLLACISSLVTLRIIHEENLEEDARRLGQHLMTGLKDLLSEYDSIGDIRGMGLLAGIELVKDRDTMEPNPEKAARIFRMAFEKGVLLNYISGAYHHVVRIVAPLTVTKEELDRLLEVLYEAFREDSR